MAPVTDFRFKTYDEAVAQLRRPGSGERLTTSIGRLTAGLRTDSKAYKTSFATQNCRVTKLQHMQTSPNNRGPQAAEEDRGEGSWLEVVGEKRQKQSKRNVGAKGSPYRGGGWAMRAER